MLLLKKSSGILFCYKSAHTITYFFDIDPLDYGYVLLDVDGDEEDDQFNLQPVISSDNVLPKDFSQPCTCGKCARDTVCPCRIRKITCCEYCKCKTSCNNPHNIDKWCYDWNMLIFTLLYSCFVFVYLVIAKSSILCFSPSVLDIFSAKLASLTIFVGSGIARYLYHSTGSYYSRKHEVWTKICTAICSQVNEFRLF